MCVLVVVTVFKNKHAYFCQPQRGLKYRKIQISILSLFVLFCLSRWQSAIRQGDNTGDRQLYFQYINLEQIQPIQRPVTTKTTKIPQTHFIFLRAQIIIDCTSGLRLHLKPIVSQLLRQNQLECIWQHRQNKFDSVHKSLCRDAFGHLHRSNQEQFGLVCLNSSLNHYLACHSLRGFCQVVPKILMYLEAWL